MGLVEGEDGVLNGIDLVGIDQEALSRSGERAVFWCHPRFRDLGLLKARFRRHRYDLHTHPTYVVALVTGGCERVRVGRRNAVAPASAVILVNPEECHDGEAGCAEGWAYRTFYPSVALMAEVAEELSRPGIPLFQHTVATDPTLAGSLRQAHQDGETGDIEAAETSMLLALRRLILGHADSRPPGQRRAPEGAARRVALCRELIESDPAARHDLARLATVTGVGRFQVIRDFRQVTGVTPAAFIRDRRVRLAERLIRAGETLAGAATAAGFADQSHLSRAFKRAHGFTPGSLARAAVARG